MDDQVFAGQAADGGGTEIYAPRSRALRCEPVSAAFLVQQEQNFNNICTATSMGTYAGRAVTAATKGGVQDHGCHGGTQATIHC